MNDHNSLIKNKRRASKFIGNANESPDSHVSMYVCAHENNISVNMETFSSEVVMLDHLNEPLNLRMF